MQKLLNPKWLLPANTLPIVVLFFIATGEYNIIKSLLKPESIQLWIDFGVSLGLLGAANFIYALYLIFRKKNVQVLYAALALPVYILYIYLFGYHSNTIVPFDIPAWMMSNDVILYVGTFLMPTLAYSVFVIVAHFTPEPGEKKAWKSFLVAIGIPVTGYLFSLTVMPLWTLVDDDFGLHVGLVLVITATVVFIFFLARGFYIVASKKTAAWKKYELLWRVPVALIFPLLGLAVNNGHLLKEFGLGGSGFFGNFNNPWFYILAFVNGALVCIPPMENKLQRYLLFAAKSITFSYTLYFFLVFLPFLPFSVIAVVLIGAGFLMLTPLALFVVHASDLANDFSFLKQHYSKNMLVLTCCVGYLVIPAVITGTYLHDRNVLHQTLAYLYSPDYSKTYSINKSSLRNTLDVVKFHKSSSRGRDIVMGGNTPYLSSWYNRLVLDNMTLSDAKMNTIERVFFGYSSFSLRNDEQANSLVKITDVKTNSTYDSTQHAWLTWVDLELTNPSANSWNAEYATTIDLPEGCWISDYYLYVGTKKEMGILAEKKSAMWVFSQIQNQNRDPGILYYLTGNKVAFRVFPFAQSEIRKTGIQFLHKEPVSLTIDNQAIQLGTNNTTANEKVEKGSVVYIPSTVKQTLKKVERKPYFHFLVDVSEDTKKHTAEFTERINALCQKHKALAENAEVSFVNSYVSTVDLKKDWKISYSSQTFEGGFYLERAIKTTLFKSYKANNNSYPVIVVVTDNIQTAILDKDFSDLAFTFPESTSFFDLGENGVVSPHSLLRLPKQGGNDNSLLNSHSAALEYTATDGSKWYVADNNKPSLLIKSNTVSIDEKDIKEKSWETALTLQEVWLSQVLHPETSDKEWLNLVKYSFISKVMTPVTSYLVVENEAQKAVLKKKQAQVLSGNKALDLGEDAQRMSEPGLIVLGILLLLSLYFKTRSSNSNKILKLK